MRLQKMINCPRCNSPKTGQILVRDFPGYRLEVKILYKELKKGHLAKFVFPEDYRFYYKPQGVNAFCSTCGYEFRGVSETVKLSGENLQKYQEEHGITGELEMIEHKMGPLQQIAGNIKRRVKGAFYHNRKQKFLQPNMPNPSRCHAEDPDFSFGKNGM